MNFSRSRSFGLTRWFSQPVRMILRQIERRPFKSFLSAFGMARLGFLVEQLRTGALFIDDVLPAEVERREGAEFGVGVGVALDQQSDLPGVRAGGNGHIAAQNREAQQHHDQGQGRHNGGGEQTEPRAGHGRTPGLAACGLAISR